jgi:CDP-diacylglycerol--glycerol-3-phosphate 3-phosphatidyltransferase
MVWIVVIRDIGITVLRSYAELKDKHVITTFLAKVKTFIQMAAIYYVLILVVLKDVGWIAANYADLVRVLLNPTWIYILMLGVTLLTFITGVQYLIDNRKILRELYVSAKQVTQSDKPLR